MKVGVIGGGQLGQMLGLAAIPLNIECIFIEPNPHCPAARVGQVLALAYDAPNLVDTLAPLADVVTVEFENVPSQTLEGLAKRVTVAPSAQTVAIAQDRLAEKTLFADLGLPTPAFYPVNSPGDLLQAKAKLGLPLRVKTRRMGYDGHGQATLNHSTDAETLWLGLGNVPCIAEVLVPLRRELSVICARRQSGEIAFYPLTENLHEGGVLHTSWAPARVDETTATQAKHFAESIVNHLDYIGVLALELFESDGGALLINEIAPRVHNSGHWTIEGAITSQFANHLRAVLDWPLGDTSARGYSVMINLIGHTPSPKVLASIQGAHVHLYGKEARPGRKLGHITLCDDDAGRLQERQRQALRMIAHAIGQPPH